MMMMVIMGNGDNDDDGDTCQIGTVLKGRDIYERDFNSVIPGVIS